MRSLLVVAMAAISLAQPLRADDPKLERLRLGANISGPNLDPKELAGKVVFLEFWGIH